MWKSSRINVFLGRVSDEFVDESGISLRQLAACKRQIGNHYKVLAERDNDAIRAENKKSTNTLEEETMTKPTLKGETCVTTSDGRQYHYPDGKRDSDSVKAENKQTINTLKEEIMVKTTLKGETCVKAADGRYYYLDENRKPVRASLVCDNIDPIVECTLTEPTFGKLIKDVKSGDLFWIVEAKPEGRCISLLSCDSFEVKVIAQRTNYSGVYVELRNPIDELEDLDIVARELMIVQDSDNARNIRNFLELENFKLNKEMVSAMNKLLEKLIAKES